MRTSDPEIHALVRQLHELTAASPDAWTDVDLTFTQLRALFVLGRQPLRVSDLATALHMSLASASALSDRLARLGLVARRRHPDDRRSVLLEVHERGAHVLGRLERAQTDRLGRAIQQMTKDERAALLTTLRAFLRVGPSRTTRAPRSAAARRAKR